MSEHVGGDTPNTQRTPQGRKTTRKRRTKAQLAAAKAAREAARVAPPSQVGAPTSPATRTATAPRKGARPIARQPTTQASGAAPSSGRWTLPMACTWLEGAAFAMLSFHGIKGSITITGKPAAA